MDYFLIFSILIALLAILYVWYVTKYSNSIPDDKPIPLESNDDRLLIHWYNMHIKHSFDFNINDLEIAAKFLERIYNIKIDPNLLVIGTNLENQYFKITGHHLENGYSPDKDCLFDVRSIIGKSGEIAIIYNENLRNSLRKVNTFDFTELNDIINSDLDIMARDYLYEVLKFRWEQITQLNDPNVLNNHGSSWFCKTKPRGNEVIPAPTLSYLYLRIPSSGNEDPLGFAKQTHSIDGNVITVLNGAVSALMTPNGARINLLCSNIEFETLIKRWKQYLMIQTI